MSGEINEKYMDDLEKALRTLIQATEPFTKDYRDQQERGEAIQTTYRELKLQEAVEAAQEALDDE